MTSANAAPQWDADELLDERYRLLELIGEGGYARVFRARDEALGREVAIKMFIVDTPDARDAGRMASETRLLATLNHPSLVTLYDARLEANPGYLVMELIAGPTLRTAIAEAPLSRPAVASLAGDLGEALQVIHSAGVVHRDIKPSNVLLRPSPLPGGHARATLADFGIASLVDTTRVTATGTLVGTAAYLSPEQARGEKPAPATDVYSLGLVLLEALTGQPGFPQGTPHETLAARLVQSPQLPADLPPEWRGLLSAMTALDPANRPDAGAVVTAAARLRGSASNEADITELMPDPAVTALQNRPADGAPPEADDNRTTTALTAVAPVLPGSAPSSPVPQSPGSSVDFPDSPDSPGSPRHDRRRWIWGLGLTALVLAAAVTVAAFSGVFSPDPGLPALPEPLRGGFEELWGQLQ